MGCSISKLDDEEAVKLCKDRKNFIKQAMEQRLKFAAQHIAYIESMSRVSAALRQYIDELRLPSNSIATPTKNPVSGLGANASCKLSFFKAERTPSLLVEEKAPASPKTHIVQTYSPVHSSFFLFSPNNRADYPPSLPPVSEWDTFWNLFSSFDYYGYHARSNLDTVISDEENEGFKQAREEGRIPDLEEDTEYEDADDQEVDLEDRKCNSESHGEIENKTDIQVAETQNETGLTNGDSKDETPGFTVYINRKPANITEVFKDLEDEFMAVCKVSDEMSSILEARKFTPPSSHSDVSARKMLNPVVLFKLSCSPSKFSANASTPKEEAISEECFISGSHQSSLDRLYAWEKKLYLQVRAGERIRLEYEKKCAQLKNQDEKEEDPSLVDKTGVSIRDLQTQISVSVQSVEAISKRIESLRDEELEPQLIQRVQGLARMWKMMAECHQRQKLTLDEAKVLLASKLSTSKESPASSPSEPNKLAHLTQNLEIEIRNWKASFDSWIISQRSYVHAITGWLLRCIPLNSDTEKAPLSHEEPNGAPTIFNICIQWSRLLDSIKETSVLEGMGSFAAGINSLYSQQIQENHKSLPCRAETATTCELVNAAVVKDEDQQEDVNVRVVCVGLSFAVNALTEYANISAQGYADLMRKWEN